MPRRRKEDLLSTEHPLDLGARIIEILTTTEKPVSKAQIARTLGINLFTKSGVMTSEHINLLTHLNALTKNSFYGTRVKTAAYLGQPTDTTAMIGQGTYGYYLAEREQEMIDGGYIEAQERSFSLVSELEPGEQKRFDQIQGVRGVDPLAEVRNQPDPEEQSEAMLAQQLREIFRQLQTEYE